MTSPAKIKKGMASNVNRDVVVNRMTGSIDIGMFATIKAVTLAIPKEAKIGTLRNRRMKKIPNSKKTNPKTVISFSTPRM